MVDRSQQSGQAQPAPAASLPQNRSSVFARIIPSLGFGRSRQQRLQDGLSVSTSPVQQAPIQTGYRSNPVRDAVHRSNLPISALDINEAGSHAILAGRDILKTVKVNDYNIAESFNLREAVRTNLSTQHLSTSEIQRRKEYLPARDVRWSRGKFAHVVATASDNGRITLLDVTTLGNSQVELAWLHSHKSQVNKLDFDPHLGYLLLSGSQDRTCKIWDIRDPRKPSGWAQFDIKAPIRDVRWNPKDAVEFALSTETGIIQKWDVRSPKGPVLSHNAHERSCYSISWHADGKHLVSGGFDKKVKVWNFKSENKRSKPIFELRTPQGIMNLAWRPPCWSDEYTGLGTWQSTQIVTTYGEDDPRIHVWDLRRPALPFREVNTSDRRAIDLCWRDKDLLWTVDQAGIFQQHDMSHAQSWETDLPPCVVNWDLDGGFYSYVMTDENEEESPDLVAKFLDISPARLSGNDEALSSQNATDDEGSDVSKPSMRREGKSMTKITLPAVSALLGKHDPEILPFDKAMKKEGTTFKNRQIGAYTRVPGIYQPPQVIKFVIDQFAQPSSRQEREHSPDTILEKLEVAFHHNANVCEAIEWQQSAGNWRVLAVVVIPELKAWADKNRSARLGEVERRCTRKEDMVRSGALFHDSRLPSPFAKVQAKNKDIKSPAGSERLLSNMFHDLKTTEQGSTSSVTTPLAKPTIQNPATSQKFGYTYWSRDDNIEPIQALPESFTTTSSTKINPLPPSLAAPQRTVEQRRAAARDYKPIQRPAFIIETPLSPTNPGRDEPESDESFRLAFPDNSCRSTGRSYSSSQ
ncbi:SEA (Seh1-associated) complex subunit, partial [Elasticomyces elasticus]